MSWPRFYFPVDAVSFCFVLVWFCFVQNPTLWRQRHSFLSSHLFANNIFGKDTSFFLERTSGNFVSFIYQENLQTAKGFTTNGGLAIVPLRKCRRGPFYRASMLVDSGHFDVRWTRRPYGRLVSKITDCVQKWANRNDHWPRGHCTKECNDDLQFDWIVSISPSRSWDQHN